MQALLFVLQGNFGCYGLCLYPMPLSNSCPNQTSEPDSKPLIKLDQFEKSSWGDLIKEDIGRLPISELLIWSRMR